MANIQFEDIEPWIDENQGDTGLTARQKLKRNFDKIKAWIDALQTDRFFDEVTLENGSKAVKLKTSYTGLFTDGFLAALGVGSEQGGGGGGGSVTSIGMSVPQGFTVSPSSISQSGTFAIGFASGYSLPSNNLQDSWTAKQDAISDLAAIRQNAANGNTAYESLNGYALESYLEGNWLVKDFSSVNSQIGIILPGDFIPGSVSLENGVLTVTNYRLQIDIPYYTSELENDSGFITSSALSGYATQSWVQNTALSGFATEDYVDTELASAISDMATKTWVGNNYLPLTGGTLTGDLVVGNTTIFASGSDGGLNSVLIGNDAFLGDCNHAGHIGVRSNNGGYDQTGFSFYASNGSHLGNLTATTGGLFWGSGRIWHSGNDGSGSGLDADTVDGYHAYQMMTKHAGENEYDNTAGLKIITVSNSTDIFGDNVPRWGSVLQWSNAYYQPSEVNSGNWYNQLYGINQDGGRLYYRNRENGGNWKTLHKIAYTTDNVASATYATSAGNADTLTTARSLWGQPFDGSGNVDGNLTFGSGYGINNLHTIYCANADLNHTLYLGYGGKDCVTWHEFGNDWQFWYGRGTGERTGGTLSVKLGATNYFEGNVGIGTQLPAYKLDVAGTLYASSNITTGGDFYAGGRLYLHQGSGNYGFYIEGVGQNNNNMSICQHYGNVYQRTFLSLVPDAVQGTNCANDVYIPNGRISIGGVSLRYDSANNALVVESRAGGTANLYATGGLAGLGIGSGSSGSVTNLTVTSELRFPGSGGNHIVKNVTDDNHDYLSISAVNGVKITGNVDITGHVGIGNILYIGDDKHYIELFGDKLQLSAYSEIQLNQETTITSTLTVDEDIWAYGYIRFGNNGYLYTSGNNLYWHNNSTNTNTKLA